MEDNRRREAKKGMKKENDLWDVYFPFNKNK